MCSSLPHCGQQQGWLPPIYPVEGSIPLPTSAPMPMPQMWPHIMPKMYRQLPMPTMPMPITNQSACSFFYHRGEQMPIPMPTSVHARVVSAGFTFAYGGMPTMATEQSTRDLEHPRGRFSPPQPPFQVSAMYPGVQHPGLESAIRPAAHVPEESASGRWHAHRDLRASSSDSHHVRVRRDSVASG